MKKEPESPFIPLCLFHLYWNLCLVPGHCPKHSKHYFFYYYYFFSFGRGSLDLIVLLGCLPLNPVLKIHTRKKRKSKNIKSMASNVRWTCKQKRLTENPSQTTAWTSSVLPSFVGDNAVNNPFVQILGKLPLPWFVIPKPAANWTTQEESAVPPSNTQHPIHTPNIIST